MRFADYAGLPGVNWSTLKHMLQSPRHYRHALSRGADDTTSRLVGRALHACALQPELYSLDYIVWTGGDRRGKAWTDFQAEHAGSTILRQVESDAVDAQVIALQSHPVAGPMLATSTHREHALQWVDPATGIACKGLVDLGGPFGIADLKGGPSLDLFERWLIREGYHLQLAFYRRGWAATFGEVPACHLIGVERNAPHDVGVFELDDTLLTIADREIDRLLRTLAACRESDTWPGRYPAAHTVHAPTWMIDPDRVESDDEDLEAE